MRQFNTNQSNLVSRKWSDETTDNEATTMRMSICLRDHGNLVWRNVSHHHRHLEFFLSQRPRRMEYLQILKKWIPLKSEESFCFLALLYKSFAGVFFEQFLKRKWQRNYLVNKSKGNFYKCCNFAWTILRLVHTVINHSPTIFFLWTSISST